MVLGTKAGDNTAANSSLRAYEQAPSFVISHLMDRLDSRRMRLLQPIYQFCCPPAPPSLSAGREASTDPTRQGTNPFSGSERNGHVHFNRAPERSTQQPDTDAVSTDGRRPGRSDYPKGRPGGRQGMGCEGAETADGARALPAPAPSSASAIRPRRAWRIPGRPARFPGRPRAR